MTDHIIVIEHDQDVVLIESSVGQAGIGIPTGGIKDDLLIKESGADFDANWVNLASKAESLTNKIIADISNNIHANTIHHPVRNTTGTTLLAGLPVKFIGWNVGQEVGEVALADQATDIAIGIIETDLADQTNGAITVSGFLQDLDTSAFTVGDILYVNVSGLLTDIRPTTGFVQPIGFVWRSANTNGVIQVLASYPLQDADDVRYTGTLTSTTVRTAIDELDLNKIENVVTDTSPELGGTLDCLNKDIDNAKTITFNSELSNSGAGAQSIDWNLAQKQSFTFTAATTITFTLPSGASNLVLKVINGGTNITWGTTILWQDGVNPTWSASGTDLLTLYYDGTNFYGMAGTNFG